MSTPITLADLIAWKRRLNQGDEKAASVRPMWDCFVASAENLRAEFAGMKKEDLKRYTPYSFSRDTKAKQVQAALDNLEMLFAVGGSVTCQMHGAKDFRTTHREAIVAQLDKWTDEQIQAEAQKRKAESSAKVKALTNPETLEEFDTYVNYHGRRGFTPERLAEVKALKGQEQEDAILQHGESKLTPEQRVKFDELRAAAGRQVRKAKEESMRTVEEAKLPAGVQFKYLETRHTQKGHALFVVQLTERVDREKYQEWLARAKKLGGYYSSYSAGGAVPGFQFKTAQEAKQFMEGEKVDGAERQETKTQMSRYNAALRMRNQADLLIQRGEEKLREDRKANTVRRATMAASIEREARRKVALGVTLRNLAEAVEGNEIKFIDRISCAAHVECLDTILRSARYARAYKLRDAGELTGVTAEIFRTEPVSVEDVESVVYPWPHFHRTHLEHMVAAAKNMPGLMMEARRVDKFLGGYPPSEDVFEVTDGPTIERVLDMAQAIEKNGGQALRDAQETILRAVRYKQVRRMDLLSEAELRAALREYLKYRQATQSEDPIVKAERALVGMKIPGFFPTPATLADEVVAQAEIEPGMRVLEPSAGKGDLAEAILRAQPEAEVDVVEVSHSLFPLLKARGFEPVHRGDFFDYNPGPVYDRIVMNPPFEDGQDIDHVQHAYELLKPGGRLVAIMSEGPFFRQKHKEEKFRNWLNAQGGESRQNPEGSFAGADAFRQTDTPTRTVTLSKAPLVQEQSQEEEIRERLRTMTAVQFGSIPTEEVRGAMWSELIAPWMDGDRNRAADLAETIEGRIQLHRVYLRHRYNNDASQIPEVVLRSHATEPANFRAHCFFARELWNRDAARAEQAKPEQQEIAFGAASDASEGEPVMKCAV